MHRDRSTRVIAGYAEGFDIATNRRVGCEFDDLVPPMAMNEAEDLLSEHGAAVTTHLYGTGHGVIPETIDDIAEWMAERIKNEGNSG